MGNHPMKFYVHLVCQSILTVIDSVLPSLVTFVDNGNLRRIPLSKDKHAMVFDMNPLNAPRLYGFMGKFFQKY